MQWEDVGSISGYREILMAKRKRYTEEQILYILGEVEAGKTVTVVCREHKWAKPLPTASGKSLPA